MALIPCPECKTEISDTAPACPRCGHALRSPVTIQQTGRRYKAAQLAGVILALAGVIALTTAPHTIVGVLGVIVLLAGFGLFIYARIGAWWRHG